MVGVAQLVEPWIVIPVVVGSSPIVHPKHCRLMIAMGPLEQLWSLWSNTASFGPLAQLVEQVTLNHLVVGSNPTRPTRLSARLECGLFYDFSPVRGGQAVIILILLKQGCAKVI